MFREGKFRLSAEHPADVSDKICNSREREMPNPGICSFEPLQARNRLGNLIIKPKPQTAGGGAEVYGLLGLEM